MGSPGNGDGPTRAGPPVSAFAFQTALRPLGDWPTARSTRSAHSSFGEASEPLSSRFHERGSVLSACLAPAGQWSSSGRTEPPASKPHPYNVAQGPKAQEIDGSLGRSWRDNHAYSAVQNWVRHQTPREVAHELGKVLDPSMRRPFG